MEGQPLGAVRVSFGYPASIQEADAFVSFLKEKFTNWEEDVWKIFGFK